MVKKNKKYLTTQYQIFVKTPFSSNKHTNTTQFHNKNDDSEINLINLAFSQWRRFGEEDSEYRSKQTKG